MAVITRRIFCFRLRFQLLLRCRLHRSLSFGHHIWLAGGRITVRFFQSRTESVRGGGRGGGDGSWRSSGRSGAAASFIGQGHDLLRPFVRKIVVHQNFSGVEYSHLSGCRLRCGRPPRGIAMKIIRNQNSIL